VATTDYIANVLRTYIDEPDQTFVDNALLTRFLQIGYQEFRNRVMQCDPNIYATQAVYTLNNTTSLDLTTTNPDGAATPILGPTSVNGSQLEMLIAIYRQESNSAIPARILNQVQNVQALEATNNSFFFSNNSVTFSYSISGTIRVSYVPSANVDWTAAGGYIDDMTLFHDLIALYAYKQYAIVDAAENGPLISQLGKRESEFMQYLTSRTTGGPNYVQDVTSSILFL
tara:strand:- start:105 stop:788 length:684 start_codon:yes stop_codon:yes gene_type:complete